MSSQITVSIQRIERAVMDILRRLGAVESTAGRALQNSFMGSPGDAMGTGGGAVQIANGSGIPAKSGGVLGSSTSYTLQVLDSSAGTLTSGSTITVWNDAGNAVASGDVYVGQDPQGNYLAITEFC
jgi:hypothetical protein